MQVTNQQLVSLWHLFWKFSATMADVFWSICYSDL